MKSFTRGTPASIGTSCFCSYTHRLRCAVVGPAAGTVLGGNLTAVGASANIVAVGIAQRAGHPVSFWDFTKRGAVVTAVSFALSVGYLWVRYFAFS